mmetsp:Transcript_7009/g.11342  ORF Transcript_7009/g.11342 Transcript_7009/m.11342 type:complete len:404 (-) Transcript_7009:538-1749(-)
MVSPLLRSRSESSSLSRSLLKEESYISSLSLTCFLNVIPTPQIHLSVRSMSRLFPIIISQKLGPPARLGLLPHVQSVHGQCEDEDGDNHTGGNGAGLLGIGTLRASGGTVASVLGTRGIQHGRSAQSAAHGHGIHFPLGADALILQSLSGIVNGEHFVLASPRRGGVSPQGTPAGFLEVAARARFRRPHRGPRGVVAVDGGILSPRESRADFGKGAYASDAHARTLVLRGIEIHGVQSLDSAVKVRLAILFHYLFHVQVRPRFFLLVEHLIQILVVGNGGHAHLLRLIVRFYRNGNVDISQRAVIDIADNDHVHFRRGQDGDLVGGAGESRLATGTVDPSRFLEAGTGNLDAVGPHLVVLVPRETIQCDAVVGRLGRMFRVTHHEGIFIDDDGVHEGHFFPIV